MACGKIYAVDFDRTLNLAEAYPQLGGPNTELISYLKERQQAGEYRISCAV